MTEQEQAKLMRSLKDIQNSWEWAGVRQFFTVSAQAEELPQLKTLLMKELERVIDEEADMARQRVAR